MLAPGLQVFHNGLPVQLLWCVSAASAAYQVWRVRPIFVTGPDRNEIFRPGEPLAPIHGRLADREVRL